MPASIFLSYRRLDAGHAGRLHDRLAQWFDADALFYDAASIDSGSVFPERIERAIAGARVVLVLIGPDWLAEINRRATLSETDFVRREIELASQRRTIEGAPAIVPVLVGGAQPVVAAALHASLRPSLESLCSFDVHIFQGKDDDWTRQFVRLRELIAAVPGVPKPRFRPPAGTQQIYRTIENRLSPHFQDPNDLLGELHRALNGKGAAAVVSPAAIYGMGGVGKTQLALKYSREYRDRYAGVWWFRSETPDGLQLDARDLCLEVGVALPDGESPTQTLARWLRGQTAPWLLVYDNAEDVASLRPHLPDDGPHHVLITSRDPAWGGVATPVQTGTWTPEQGADFLAARLRTHPRAGLVELSRTLGGLPLALEQAAGYLEQNAITADEYSGLLANVDTAALLLDDDRSPTGYERSVLATLSLAFERLTPAAQQLLRLCAFCAPEPIPERLFRDGANLLPPPLAEAAENPLRWNAVVGELRHYGLADRVRISPLVKTGGQETEPALQFHRLVQEVVQHRLCYSLTDADVALGLIDLLLPREANFPENWPLYARLRPHIEHFDRLRAATILDPAFLSCALDRLAAYLREGPALYSASRALFERAIYLSRSALGEEHPNTLAIVGNLAATLSNQGDFAGARAVQEKVLDACRRMLGEEHPATLISMANLATTLAIQGDAAGARLLQEKSLDIFRHTLGEEHLDTLRSTSNLAVTLQNQGALADARLILEKVLDTRRQNLGEEDPETLESMNRLARVLQDQGEFIGARLLEEKALDVRRRILGEEHPATLNSMEQLGETLRNLGDLSNAQILQKKALDATRRIFGEDHPKTFKGMNSLALTLYSQHDFAGARVLYEKVFNAYQCFFGEEHPDTLISMCNLAVTIGRRGDHVGARVLMEKVLDAHRRIFGDEHPATLTSMNNLAHTLWQSGERHEAVALMVRAVGGRTAKLGREHPDTLDSQATLDRWRAAGES